MPVYISTSGVDWKLRQSAYPYPFSYVKFDSNTRIRLFFGNGFTDYWAVYIEFVTDETNCEIFLYPHFKFDKPVHLSFSNVDTLEISATENRLVDINVHFVKTEERDPSKPMNPKMDYRYELAVEVSQEQVEKIRSEQWAEIEAIYKQLIGENFILNASNADEAMAQVLACGEIAKVGTVWPFVMA